LIPSRKTIYTTGSRHSIVIAARSFGDSDQAFW
jgi:hypothetical protein